MPSSMLILVRLTIIALSLAYTINTLDIYEPVLTSIDSYSYGDISQDGRLAAFCVLALSGAQYIKVFTLSSKLNETSQLVRITFPNYPTNLLQSIKLDSTGSTMAVVDAKDKKLFTFLMNSGNFSTTANQEINMTQTPISLDLSKDGNSICVAGQRLNALVYKSSTLPKSFVLSQTLSLVNQTGNSNLNVSDQVKDCQFARDSTILIISAAEKYIFDYRFNQGTGKYQFRVEVPTNLVQGQTIKIVKLIQNLLAVGTTTRLIFFRLNNGTNNFEKFQEIPTCNTISIDMTLLENFVIYECQQVNQTNVYLLNSTKNEFENNMTIKNNGNMQGVSLSEKGNFLMLLTDYFIGNFTLFYAHPCFPGQYQENVTQICKLCSSKFTADCLLCNQTQCTCKQSQGYSATRRTCSCTNNLLCGLQSSTSGSTNTSASTNSTANNSSTDIGIEQLNQSASNLAAPIAISCASVFFIAAVVLAIFCLRNKIPFLNSCFIKEQNIQSQVNQNNQTKLKGGSISSTSPPSNPRQIKVNKQAGVVKFIFTKQKINGENRKFSSTAPLQGKKFTDTINRNTDPSAFRQIHQKQENKGVFKLSFLNWGNSQSKNSTKDKFYSNEAPQNQNKFEKGMSKKDSFPINEYPQISGERLQHQLQI